MVKVKNAPHLLSVNADARTKFRLRHAGFAQCRMNRQLDGDPWRQAHYRLSPINTQLIEWEANHQQVLEEIGITVEGLKEFKEEVYGTLKNQ